MFGLGLAFAASTAEPIVTTPDIHGDRIVYSSQGDLWIGNWKTGDARRLTSDPGVERSPSFSPDGTQIAFEAEYDGRQAYVMPASGGKPRKLTYAEGFRSVTGWTPDGKEVLFRKVNTPTNYDYSTVPATGGAVTRIPLEFASHVWFGPSREDYAFTRFNRWYAAWFHYRGGMQNQIWVRKDGKFRQITSLPGTSEFPVWLKDRIYFVNEQNAQFTLMSVPAAGGPARNELPPSPLEIVELSTDGTNLVYQKGLDAEVFDPETRRATPVKLEAVTDNLHAQPASVSAQAHFATGAATPTGKRLLAESRGAILSLPFGEGEARVWKQESGRRLRYPSPSPDGKKVAYTSDEGGEANIWVADSDGKNPKKLTDGSRRQIVGISWSPDSKTISYSDSTNTLRVVDVATGRDRAVATVSFSWFGIPHSWSPDSRYIAYSQVLPVTFFYAIEIYEVATGSIRRVSTGDASDFAPSFSADGKRLAYLTNRSIRVENDFYLNQLNAQPGTMAALLLLRADDTDPLAPTDPSEPAPPPAAPAAGAPPATPEAIETKIDWEGLAGRRVELPLPPGAYTKAALLGNRFLAAGPGGIVSYDLAAKAATPLDPASTFELTPDRTQLILPGPGGMSSLDLASREKKAASFGGLRLEVNPEAEWRQIFWDAWRLLRDYFYVANMHGVDWPAIGRKYEALLPRVKSRSELDILIRWMQAELGSSHQYLDAGDERDIKTRLPGAYLGIDIAADPSGRYRITKILRGDGFRNTERSPLLGPGRTAKEGMFLLAIGGQELRVGEDPWASLEGRAGAAVSVTLNDNPTLEGAKTFLVRPIASEQRMRYLDWVRANRDYVSKKSGGKVGYIHLSAMGTGDMEDFIRQYFSQRDKQALLVDSRFNNGGFVQDYINRILNSRLDGYFNMRNSPHSWTRQQDYFNGPIAMVMNEFNISCGEEFPHRFRNLGRGVLIGRRTMGGEVGSDPGWPLIDGGTVMVPNYGMWVPGKGWVIEGPGVSPDIDVPSDPQAFIEGRDPQLDKAVEWLLKEIPKQPTPIRTTPADPIPGIG